MSHHPLAKPLLFMRLSGTLSRAFNPLAYLACSFIYVIILAVPTAAQQNRPIVVGSIFAKSGIAAKVNIQNFNLVRFAIREINEQGGLLGRSVILLEYDNRSSPLGAYTAAEKAVQDDVACVFGPFWSSHAFAMAKVFQNAKIPMIAAATTSDGVTRTGDYIFRAGFIDSFQARVITHFATTKLGARTAAVLTNISTPYSTGLTSHFRKFFEKDGRKIIYTGEYLMDAADFATHLKAIRKLKPDVVFLPAYSRDASLILKQAAGMGLETTFIGGDGWSAISRFPNFGRGIKGTHYFVSHWHKSSTLPESVAFMKRYAMAQGANAAQSITSASIISYDAVGLFADAVKRAQSLRPEDIRNVLAKTKNYKGVSGNITMGDYGDPIKSAVILSIDKSSTIKFVTTITPDAIAVEGD